MNNPIRNIGGFGLLLVAMSAYGQPGRGAITGAVKDPVGAIVAGATVQAMNPKTGAVVKTTSSPGGTFTLGDLPPGTYDISLSIPGVAPFSRKDVAVGPGAAVRVDIELKEGSQLSTLGEDSLAPDPRPARRMDTRTFPVSGGRPGQSIRASPSFWQAPSRWRRNVSRTIVKTVRRSTASRVP